VPTRQIKRVTVFIIGWTLVAFGIVGLFLPVLQGILFILLGLYVLSRESVTAHRLFQRLRARYPAVDDRLRRLKARLRALWPAAD
jgi:uncharacterized membrane protein YbaN (DUF454 family)